MFVLNCPRSLGLWGLWVLMKRQEVMSLAWTFNHLIQHMLLYVHMILFYCCKIFAFCRQSIYFICKRERFTRLLCRSFCFIISIECATVLARGTFRMSNGWRGGGCLKIFMINYVFMFQIVNIILQNFCMCLLEASKGNPVNRYVWCDC